MTTKACPKCSQQIPANALLCQFCKADFREVPPPAPPSPSGSPVSLGFILVAVILCAVVVVGILPMVMYTGGRAYNDRNASATLKTICTAEADFRSNDRDNDGVTNFWTRDVYGLYALCPSTNMSSVPVPAPGDMIKLVEPSCAGADATGKSLSPACVAPGLAIAQWSPKAGYVYLALESFEDSGGVRSYGESGAIAGFGPSYTIGRFGFMTMPLSLSSGRTAFFVDERCTVYRFKLESGYAATYAGGKSPTASFSWSGAKFARTMAVPEKPDASGWAALD